MRLDAFGTPNFIEAKLMPGLSDHGYLSRCFFLNMGVGYDEMILSIVNLGIERTRNITPKKSLTTLHTDLNEIVAPELAGTGVVV